MESSIAPVGMEVTFVHWKGGVGLLLRRGPMPKGTAKIAHERGK
jgi:hypothetical protein